MIWIKLLKKWGEYKIGDIAKFDRSKGERLIKAGIAEITREPEKSASAEPEKKPEPVVPIVETAVETPVVETVTAPTDVRPARYKFKRASLRE